MENHLFKIGEIAAFFNVSVKAIRIYEKKDIMRPAMIDPATGYRYFSADQVQTLDALLELKSLGFALAEIKKIIAGGLTRDDLSAALLRKRLAWRNSIAAAEHKIDVIDKMVERLDQSKDAVKLQTLTDEERAWLLVKMVCVEDLRAQSALSEALWL